MSKKPIPFHEVLKAFSPEELEAIYPGITAPQGFLRYTKGDATGQRYIDPPEILQAMHHGAKLAKHGATAQVKKEKLSREELLGAFQQMIQGAAPVVNQGAAQPIPVPGAPGLSASIGPASINPAPAFPGVSQIQRSSVGPATVHRNVRVALDE
jgi:hypothetical protein